MLRGHIVACLVLAAGCYSPAYVDCEVTCEARGLCPAGMSCTDGFCRVAGATETCPAACATCDGSDACIDLDNDNANCGTCGNVCGGTEPCFEGACDGRRVKEMAGGEGHGCALLVSGSVHCWGANEFGQLGNPMDVVDCGGRPCRHAPMKVNIPKARSIAAGGWSTCAVLQNDTVTCWGRSELGAIGHDPINDPPCMDNKPCAKTAVPIAELAGIADVVLSEFAGCARGKDGSVSCWGLNKHGNAGNGTDGAEPSANLKPVTTSITGAVKITLAGGFGPHGCALFSNGTLSCWGDNAYSGTGHATNTSGDVICNSGNYCARTPVAAQVSSVGDVFASSAATCAITGTEQATCWGFCGNGLAGAAACGAAEFPPALISVPSAGGFASIAGRYGHACGSQGMGLRTIWCWGLQTDGQLGAKNIATETCAVGICRRTPSAVVPELKGYPYPARGPFTLAVDVDGVAWGWGANQFGQTGHPPGSNNDETCTAGPCSYAPVMVLGLP